MSTPQDQQRVRAFQAFVKTRENPDATRDQLGISPRSWERMCAGRKPPPVRLFPRLALIAWDSGLERTAQALWEAGIPPSLLAADTALSDTVVERLRAHLAETDSAECARIAAMAGGNHA